MSIQISDKSFEGFKQAYATLSAAVTKFQAQAEGAGGKVGTILTQEIYDTARQCSKPVRCLHRKQRPRSLTSLRK